MFVTYRSVGVNRNPGVHTYNEKKSLVFDQKIIIKNLR